MFKRIYKILIVSVLFLSMVMSVNAGTTYLNSCGQNIILSNEVYILNFTSTNYNGGCLIIPKGYTITNTTIKGIAPIKLNSSNFDFLQIISSQSLFSGSYGFQNSFIKDITFYSDNNIGTISHFLYLYWGSSRASNRFYNNQITNVTLNLPVTNLITAGVSYSNLNGGINYFSKNTFTNVNFNNVENFLTLNRPMGNFGMNGGIYSRYNNFVNSYIHSNKSITILNTGYGIVDYTGWNFDSSVFLSDTDVGWSYTSSITNSNNGINPVVNYVTPATHLVFNGYNFLLNVKDGRNFLSSTIPNVFVNDEIYGASTPALLSIFNNNNVTLYKKKHSHNSRSSITINNGGVLDCAIFDKNKCIMDNNATTATSGDSFKGSIGVKSNVLINNIDYSSYDKNNLGANVQVISNFDQNLQQNNIKITNNKIFSNGNFLTSNSPLWNIPILKLYANNVLIKNNNFSVNYNFNAGQFEFIDLKGTIPTSNMVTKNRFVNLMTNPTYKSEIFEYNADTIFYNNYISNNILISNKTQPNLKLSKLKGFLHNDGKIYYFNIGNFYEENIACVDLDINGICDNPYTSGSVTDNYPLSSYPFDYTQHLFTYDKIVDNKFFNITTLVNNNIFNSDINVNVVDVNSVINLSFYQNSTFPDLICDYIVNGVLVNGGTILNPNQSQTYTIPVTNWNVGLNTYRVECFNEFGTKSSIEYNLNVSYSNNPVVNPNPVNPNSTPYSSIDVIDYNSVDNTNANTIGFMQDIIGFVTNVGIPLGILLVVVISVFAVLRLLM